MVADMPRPRPPPASNSLAWLIARYRETVAWSILSAATRRQRENIFLHAIASAGMVPYARITEATIKAGRDRRASTPAQARNFLDAMRGLFRWAKEADLVKVDPTASVKNPKRRKGPGFKIWTEDEMTAYDRRWPIGTRQRVWRDLSPIPAFAAAMWCAWGAIGKKGEPLAKTSFGNEFKKACQAAGVPGSAHGVRKTAATRAAENGATVAELEAIFGWHGGAMAAHYTREANRVRLAKDAMHKLANTEGTSIPAPDDEVRAAGEKPNEINPIF